ncbi:MAG: dihydrolipoyl dehydrogenase [Proteobacteria bacterium]|nr:dihydrolipoyl dehydrogenase [Verrucomicrobiota bacterium]NBU08832.1 dihydrolipoyl dehydrogenase [Pseudomonadota bacterium]
MDNLQADIAVIGGGPGGYAAAFYAADLGKKVVLIERGARLGGACLNEGCIPSKALLHATHALPAAGESALRGITFGPAQIDLAKLRGWKDGVLTKLGNGISSLAQKRGVQVVVGKARFTSSHSLAVQTTAGELPVEFTHAIIATGSRPALPRSFNLGHPRVMTSTGALELADIPGELLVVGGGYIGMEMGTVYARLGSRVTVVEALDSILAGADADLSRLVVAYGRKLFKEVRVKTSIRSLTMAGERVRAVMETNGESKEELYDRVLIAVGRVANSGELGLENTQATLDPRGCLTVNDRQQTADPALYAIGDVAGGVMLAHKAARDARVAVEAILGLPETTRHAVVPAVVFTDPEIAWVGLTEAEAKARAVAVEIAKFQWGASGRALTNDRPDGVTKLIIEPQTEQILGVGIAGQGAGELIAEATIAVEHKLTARGLAHVIHPHPTLSETLMEAAESFYGHGTHALPKKKSSRASQQGCQP